MNKLLWHDAKVDPPKTSDPVLGLTSDGYMVVVQYRWKKHFGKWYELSADDSYDTVVKWADVNLPHGWNISDDYYKGEDE